MEILRFLLKTTGVMDIFLCFEFSNWRLFCYRTGWILLILTVIDDGWGFFMLLLLNMLWSPNPCFTIGVTRKLHSLEPYSAQASWVLSTGSVFHRTESCGLRVILRIIRNNFYHVPWAHVASLE